MAAFERTQLLLGPEAMDRLAHAHVAVFGIGGVGGHATEALCRSGIGHLTIVDNDTVAESNLNRQLIATVPAIGRPKVEVMRERLLAINPDCAVEAHAMFYLPETADRFDFTQYDYVLDCIDTVAGKVSLAVRAREAGTPIISAMGAGNKLDPTRFQVADISKTSVCPLARAMRHELKKHGIQHLKVVYSTEEPVKPQDAPQGELPPGKRAIPGSIAFVPSVMGLIMAGEVVRDIAGV